MEVIRIIHIERRQEVEILVDDVVFYVDGSSKRFYDPRQSAITVAVAQVSPRCLTFDEIKRLLIRNGRHGIRDQEHLDLAYLRKKIMEINEIFMSCAGTEKIIRSVRGKGYSLSSDWVLDRINVTERVVQDEIGMLEKLIGISIATVESCEFHVDKENNKTLIVDRAQSAQNELILSFIHEKIIGLLRINADNETISSISEGFSLLSSYVTFSRVGNNISDEHWRNAFRVEIVNIYKQLRSLIDNTKLR